MDGWVKFYRKLLDNPLIMKDIDHLGIWAYLLLNATHKERQVLFNGTLIMLKKGELITGRKSIALKLKVDENKVQRVLNSFKKQQLIEQQTCSKNRLISILKWEEYQDSEQQKEQQVNNKRTTSEQQVNTNKNERKKEYKNYNSEKKLKHKNYEQRPAEDLESYYDNVEVANGL